MRTLRELRMEAMNLRLGARTSGVTPTLGITTEEFLKLVSDSFLEGVQLKIQDEARDSSHGNLAGHVSL